MSMEGASELLDTILGAGYLNRVTTSGTFTPLVGYEFYAIQAETDVVVVTIGNISKENFRYGIWDSITITSGSAILHQRLKWVSPVIELESTDYYNFCDINRIEKDTKYLKDEFTLLGYDVATTTFILDRVSTSFDFFDSMNRLENNILGIKNGTFTPLLWTTPQVNWASVQQSFSFIDANRIANNIYYLYLMLNNIKDAYLFVGDTQASICGKGNTLF